MLEMLHTHPPVFLYFVIRSFFYSHERRKIRHKIFYKRKRKHCFTIIVFV